MKFLKKKRKAKLTSRKFIMKQTVRMLIKKRSLQQRGTSLPLHNSKYLFSPIDDEHLSEVKTFLFKNLH